MAQEIGNILGTAPHYERVPSCTYDIAGYRLDKEGVLHIPEGAEETTKDLILQLRERGFQDDAEITEEVPVQQDKLTIVIPRESLTDTALENLQKITANKQTLFQRAFRMDSTEIEITDEKINITLMENHTLYTVGNWSLRINFQRARNHAFPFVNWKNR